jgi:hypothetical protein
LIGPLIAMLNLILTTYSSTIIITVNHVN